MNSNSSLSFSSSLPSPAYPSTHRPSLVVTAVPAKQPETLESKLAYLGRQYPEIAVFVRRGDDEAMTVGVMELRNDLLIAYPYISQFLPEQSGHIVIDGRKLRIHWARHHCVIVMVAFIRPTGTVRSFEKSIRRNMRTLIRLALA
jgi:hypothetical protein